MRGAQSNVMAARRIMVVWRAQFLCSAAERLCLPTLGEAAVLMHYWLHPSQRAALSWLSQHRADAGSRGRTRAVCG